MIVTIDTSALLKLLIAESETAAVTARLQRAPQEDDVLCISSLAVAEMRRACLRAALSVADADAITSRFRVIRLSEAVLQLAARLPASYLRTLDAIHLATALEIEARAMMTYDHRLREAAEAEGLEVIAPRPEPQG